MIDAEKLAAFAVVTGMTSLVPGPSMLFVLSQSVWRGARSGAAALAGLQMGYVLWWLLAALGLGTLAAASPLRLPAAGGGRRDLSRVARCKGAEASARATAATLDPPLQPATHALRDGVLVAIGNPKSLIYIVALLPPFVDSNRSVAPQLLVLAATAMTIDIALGSLYILAGSRLAAKMTEPATRRRIDVAVGVIFIAIAAMILAELFGRGA